MERKILPQTTHWKRRKGTLLGKHTRHPCSRCWNTTHCLLPLHPHLMCSLLAPHEPINMEGESFILEGVKEGRSSLPGCRSFEYICLLTKAWQRMHKSMCACALILFVTFTITIQF